MTYLPRNNLVLLRRCDLGAVRGIHMPGTAAEGKALFVEAAGPDVKDLRPGQRVLAVGTPGEDLVRIPGEADLYLTREGNVLAAVED